MTLRALAEKLGVHFSYISDVEHDRRVPSEEVTAGIASELGIDAWELLLRSGRISSEVKDYLRRQPAAHTILGMIARAKLHSQELVELKTVVARFIVQRRPT